MLRAGVEGLAEGATAAGLPVPKALAVTILTSEGQRPPSVLAERVAAAVEAGAAGFVCSAGDVRDAKRLAPRLLAVVAGIRPEGTPAHDQAAPATPSGALAAGADILVVGRAVTAADDPAAAAAALADKV
jgi:orotidine-5'-phosphate decarboxylase